MDKTCYYIFAYVAVLLTFPMSCPTSSATSLAIDQSALLVFRAHIFTDPHHILTRNWTNSSSVCSWIGVSCGSRPHRVAALNISGMGLSGTIPPELGNLSFVVSLDLSNNLFVGALPPELSLLRRLKFISLRANNVTGEIPEQLGNLSNLQVLNMENNGLWGPIPPAIFNISTLQFIAFTYNELSGGLPVDMCRNLQLLERIQLSKNQLSGQIPTNLSQCSQLRVVSLSYNSLSGHIPAGIGKLEFLENLALGGNNLSGSIPQEITNLKNLFALGIENNQITGALPLNIFNMSSLQVLLLWRNKLIGNLPRDIANLTLLNDLELMENNLKGDIPKEVGQLRQLQVLGLDSNAFTSTIPPELYNISALLSLGLNENSLSGALPTNLCRLLPLLEELYLSGNDFFGPIPSSISDCAHLTLLALADNKFTGFVPHSFSNLSLLRVLDLSGNNLTVEPRSSELSFITSLTNCTSLVQLVIAENPLESILPASIGNLSTALEYFYAANCRIKGGIPANIGSLSSLVKLSLHNNELSGEIPNSINGLDKLQGLSLGNNNLGGFLPLGLCHLHSLSAVYLSWNRFSGPIPECLVNLTSLRELRLNSNMLNSSIPSSIWSLGDFLILNLSSNSLTGFLPPQMGNLVGAIMIDLSRNQFSGSIPSTVGNLQNLVNLSLAYNRFEGSIPLSVGSMISLVALDFSYNNLSGTIPKTLEALQYLEYFNVSFNDLSGEIPNDGPFRNFNMESFEANDNLCGDPRFNVPLCRAISNNRSRRKKVVQLALFTLPGVVALIVIVSLVFIVLKRRTREKTASGVDLLVSAVPERVSYYEILQATEQFDESNLLGVGSFGSVYRGILRNGQACAVKVFNMPSEAVLRSFGVECEVLRNIRHRNLVKVISSCSNEDFKALVLEYMPRGNLEEWLYSHNHCLDVMQRLNIMIDVASAVEYLHHGYTTPIVHCDLKPSNVLLDEEMTAHVSDFGVAKLLGDGESVVLTKTLATLGYIAPEYGLEGLVSTRCDVYSYGVMLMETFTRKKPSDDMFAGDVNLKSWVESSLLKSSRLVVDENLLVNHREEHAEKVLECVISVLVLALKCSAEFPGDRINMKEALAELQKIKRLLS